MRNLLAAGFVLIGVSTSLPARAENEDQTAKVEQVSAAKHLILVTFAIPVNEGVSILATAKDDSKCTLKVVKAKGMRARLDTTECLEFEKLAVGQAFNYSIAQAENAGSEPPKNSAEEAGYNRDLSDLMYKPLAKKIGVSLGYGRVQNSLSASNSSNGQSLVSQNETAQPMSATLAYGLTNQFEVDLSVGYQLSDLTTTTVNTTPSSSYAMFANGFTNPALGIAYRLFEHPSFPVIVDIGISYSPNIGSASSPTPGNSGSSFRGGDLTKVAAQIGGKYSRFSYDLGTEWDLYGNQTISAAGSSAQQSTASYSVYGISLLGQYNLLERLGIMAGLLYANLGSINSVSQGLTTSTGSYSTDGFELGAFFSIVPNKYVLNFKFIDVLSTNYTSGIYSAGIGGPGYTGVGLSLTSSAQTFNLALQMQF